MLNSLYVEVVLLNSLKAVQSQVEVGLRECTFRLLTKH